MNKKQNSKQKIQKLAENDARPERAIQPTELLNDTLRRIFGCELADATQKQVYRALCISVRELLTEKNRVFGNRCTEKERKEVYYMSMEFLVGTSLRNNLFNLGLEAEFRKALADAGFDIDEIYAIDPDAGLGNGGLGRLASCYMDAATGMDYPMTGFSIRYEFGIFKQKIVDGWQMEFPDNWLEMGDVWLQAREDDAVEVKFGGEVREWMDNDRFKVAQVGYSSVMAVPYDMYISGYDSDAANRLVLWSAKLPQSFDMAAFSRGDYVRALERNAMAETISKVLYPADDHIQGKRLRLKQQYFFVSATMQSITRKHIENYGTLKNFHEKNVIQINDTHPALVIPELMRILVDDAGLDWDEAWHIVTHCVAYTNHTVMAEALEVWPQQLFETLLPRIWQILQEIAHRWQRQVEDYFHDPAKTAKLAIIWDGHVRMANLCLAGTMAVNGVSALHSEILRKDVFKEACQMMPDKFKNVTNGIDHRRWLPQINRGLNDLICDLTGDGYLTRPQELKKLEAYADDASVLRRLEEIKHQNKLAFAAYARKQQGVVLNTDAIFDVQVKRLHEYKRQLLNVLHIIYLYQRLQEDPNMEMRPQTFLFGAKAAPGYAVAKRIIHLINSLAAQIDRDPICKDKLQVVFLENYRVSLAEMLMPASEVSQQISTAGKEAIGTGNMKFMMNGALTVGTLDGANVEMHEVLGDENMFLFGLKADEVAHLRHTYDPQLLYQRDPVLRRVVDQLKTGFGDGVTYEDIWQRLVMGGDGPADQYMVLADFAAYCAAEERMSRTYGDRAQWNRMSLLNIARSGIFAADRAIAQYADTIWHVPYKK